MAVLYNHSLVSGQSVGDTVLTLTVHGLQHNRNKCLLSSSLTEGTKVMLFIMLQQENRQQSLGRALFKVFMFFLH